MRDEVKQAPANSQGIVNFEDAHDDNERQQPPEHEDADGGPLILPSPSMPMQVAREFVTRHCLHDAEALTIRYWCGCWWTWRTTHWAEAQPHAVRTLLYRFTEDAKYWKVREGKLPELTSWSPDRRKIGDLLEALSSLVILPDDFEQPCWIDGRQTGPIVATSNGLLDVASRKLHKHTPLYFGQVSVPFPYDPNAPEPTKWLDFLDALWPNEVDAIEVLGEWFGYVISGRLDLHKIMLMVGPTRGGKGVIARILGALIGKRNVCGPTLNSLGGEFGLAPLLGKSLAVISDARLHQELKRRGRAPVVNQRRGHAHRQSEVSRAMDGKTARPPAHHLQRTAAPGRRIQRHHRPPRAVADHSLVAWQGEPRTGGRTSD
jgi:putative DNA primase/helicase